jgi:hypothetical protein
MRAPLTAPPVGLLAAIFAMHACTVAPGAYFAHASFNACWLRARSARPAASRSASDVVTSSVAFTIFANFSGPEREARRRGRAL